MHNVGLRHLERDIKRERNKIMMDYKHDSYLLELAEIGAREFLKACPNDPCALETSLLIVRALSNAGVAFARLSDDRDEDEPK